MTIRLRLTLWYTALLGATLILFSVAVYSAVTASLRVQLEQNASSQARDIANIVTQQIEFDLFILGPNADALFPAVDLFAMSAGVQIVNPQGNIIARSANLGNLTLPNYRAALPKVLAGEDDAAYIVPPDTSTTFLVYSVPLVAGERIRGAIQVIQPVQSVIDATNQVSRYLMLGTGISLVLAAILGAFLARRALAPIDTIANTADTITRTRDLGKRIHIADNASEVGRLGATFNAMLDRIQRLFTTQERLIGDVSHELRTPLTTVQGNVELLQRMAVTPAPDAGPRVHDYMQLLGETLTEVQVETERMSTMVADLLLLAQADSGELKLQSAPVEVDTLLLDVYRQARRLAEHYKGPQGLDIRLGSEDQALVIGDRDKLRQVILNLVENAIKYTPAGGAVTLGLSHENGWVKVVVEDTGIGISPEQQALIFDRFYRTDKARSREFGGSGLGLSIAQSIAHAHQGRITVESTLGAGSTFTLWLPEGDGVMG
jgi:signal transduction histidine kinase